MSEGDTSFILTSPETPSSAAFQVAVSAPPSDGNQSTATSNDIETPLPLFTKPEEPESSGGADACARGLWEKAYASHQCHELRADSSLVGKTTEQLVRYLIEEPGFEEVAARVAVSIYPPRVLSKLHRETPNGMPTVGQLRAVSDEEWEEKSRR